MRNISQNLRSGAVVFALSALTGSVFFAAPQPARAIPVVCTNCSTMIQQALQYAKEIETAVNTANQLSTQINQYNEMIKQGIALPDRIVGQITGDLQKVVDVYNSAKVLGRNLSTLDDQFKSKFKSYQDWQNAGFTADTWNNAYTQWSEDSADNVQTALQSAGINVSTFDDESASLDKIVNDSQSATSRLAAIQAGNQIAAMNVQQLQKLRDLLYTQINMQANYMAQQQDQRNAVQGNAAALKAPDFSAPSRKF